MKLTKIKILTLISGLLTLNGLAMLFSGLVIQMNESSDFDSAQALAARASTNGIIFLGVIVAIGFGATFFNCWAKMRNKHHKSVKLV